MVGWEAARHVHAQPNTHPKTQYVSSHSRTEQQAEGEHAGDELRGAIRGD